MRSNSSAFGCARLPDIEPPRRTAAGNIAAANPEQLRSAFDVFS
jgi:hypothetical protein